MDDKSATYRDVDALPFWRAVRSDLMPRGDGWKPVVEGLPGHLGQALAGSLLQPADQLASLAGQGHVAGALVSSALDPAAVAPFLSDSSLSLENVALQWLYRYLIVEGVCEHNRALALGGWNPMFLALADEGLHFMTYMAAILVMMEEGKLPNPMDRGGFPAAEPLVRRRVSDACAFLHPKAQDYGESFRRHGLPGLLPRLWDKIARYAQLRSVLRTSNFEKREDSARDMLGYSCIAWSLLLELPAGLRSAYLRKQVWEVDPRAGTWTRAGAGRGD